ncbi:MAG: hypothetical protein IT247_02250 [Bacteroidia bacterium]|nr:hypothetical protein [Bacteroidia bacterium]
MKTKMLSVSKKAAVCLLMIACFLPSSVKAERFPELFLKSPQTVAALSVTKKAVRSEKIYFRFVNPFRCNKKKLSTGFKAVLKNKKGSYINLFIGFEI